MPNSNLPKPDIFEGTKPNSSALIISGGHSTKQILERKKEVRKQFDVIIVVNRTFQFFDDIADFHIITEKTSISSDLTNSKLLHTNNYRTDLPRIINYKGIEFYPKKYNRIQTNRSNFNFAPDIRKYSHNGHEGLLTGPIGKKKMSIGSVTLSAMHFAGILGSNKIYLIGADMCFKDEYDHFYKDNIYRKTPSWVKKEHRHNIVRVEVDGRFYETTEYFKQSAEYISSMITTIFKDVPIFDFSDGLLKNTNKINISNFL